MLMNNRCYKGSAIARQGEEVARADEAREDEQVMRLRCIRNAA